MYKMLARTLVLILTAIGLLVVLVTATPLTSLWAARLASPWHDDRGGTLIVLAAESLNKDVVGVSSYWRCFYTALAWRSGAFRQVVVSGDSVVGPMKSALVSMGVPAAAIQLDSQSGTTRLSALHCRDLLAAAPGPKVLLTSDYHVFRARRAFLKAGLPAGVSVVPDVTKRSTSWSGRWPAFLDLLSETCKIAYYYFKGWI